MTRAAIVTGAAGALGAVIADRFEATGMDVLRVDQVGDDCFHADVGTVEGNRAMVEEAVARFGRVDVLVPNAGTQHTAEIPDYPVEEWDRLMNVMARGPFLAAKFAWPYLIERPGGRIVVTASASSFVAERTKSAYVAAKHAVLGFVRTAAIEGAPHGLTANAVAPAWMRTPLIETHISHAIATGERTRKEVLQDMLSRHPVNRFVELDEVAAAVLFLAGEGASGVNGACLPVDLGTLAG
ncbi:3-hydroxybutyrate dehydrogenase [Actinomadura viridis]|uniref:3-hydroxybutyrate dehydrogenase n=1 Tax=Actinomadura viridis TaxID=58110 RepID=A0A931D7R1_9ACTN|nr:SDR family oxidoreductase [Actinomadura viridis]MBG6085994.1 3-hydroxybutyrate dehydrogenase [Actinomadura viridis]